MFGTHTDWETKQNAYINLIPVNEISKYSIIIPIQKNKKRVKLEFNMKDLNNSWVKMILKWDDLKKNKHINSHWWNEILLEWM